MGERVITHCHFFFHKQVWEVALNGKHCFKPAFCMSLMPHLAVNLSIQHYPAVVLEYGLYVLEESVHSL